MPKVAIIEDDQSTNDHLRDLISKYPVEILQAFNREDAIQIIENHRLDVVIVDVDLGPGPKEKYAGFELLNLLNGKKTITLVVSGVPQPNLHEVALSFQAYDFIGKPIPDLSFVNKFEHALRTSQMREDESIVKPGEDGLLPEHLTKDPYVRHTLRWKGQVVKGLTLTHLRLIACLVENPGVPITKIVLAKQLGTSNATTAIATHMSEIRKKFVEIDQDFDRIQPEPGVGYVWKTKQ
ncbi:DNA-binding response OmpR family regulator [Duganella sp. 1224]|uniref:response regulator transcription factor n=1 Tax=Duganella sp. 1224 TaxID=2587052 RepID=UPI0015CAE2D1|nr:response regulator [Duganella sp. 1224]NYE63153.1 DNA-binding response OmpR family regulator [Duganella sp. 1224]